MLAAAVVVAVLAIACSGDGDDRRPSPTPGSATEASPQATANPLGSAEPDGELARDHVEKLAAEIGPRTAGTPAEIEARDYLKKVLEGFGYVVTLQEVPFDASAFLPARVDAGETALGAIALRGSAGGTATGPLVVAGIGRPEEFPPGGIGGGLALVRRGDLTFAEKTRNARAAGASGVIIYNNEDGRFSGDTEETTIPVVGLSKGDGEMLLARLSGGPVEAKITVTPPRATGYNVIAKPTSTTACRTVTGGHYDSVPVTGGADDNASGTGAVLELARVVAAADLAGDHCFVLFGVEEFGLFGSRAFVQNLTITERNTLEAMLNFDVVGVREPLVLIGSADLAEQARLLAEDAGVIARVGSLPVNASSDHASFEQVGIPNVMFNRDDFLIHTQQDAIDRIEAQSLEDVVVVGLALLMELGAR